MLPVRLSLRDFISYGEPEESVDFRGFRLACISGNNGEGKSALLDAITWALWGVARGTDLGGRGGEDLIRLGAEEALVVFEFEAEGDLWRVTRSRRRGRAGGGLALSRWSDAGWQEASGATATLTQKFLDSLLGLDYQSFINSAFLLQGKADEFARQTASDRKKILADILGLSVFEGLSEKARSLARAAQTKADLLEVEIERLTGEISREPELQQRTGETRQRLSLAQEELSRAREEAKAKEEVVLRLEAKARQAKELGERAEKAAQRSIRLQEEEKRTAARLAECNALLNKRGEIEAGFSELSKRREEAQEWGEKAAIFADLAKQREQHALAAAREKAELESRLSLLKGEVEKLRAQSRDEETKTQAEACAKEIASIEARQEESAERQKALRARREEAVALRERVRQLEGLSAEKAESLGLLEGAEALCPVCRSRLSEARRQELISTLKTEIETIASDRKESEEKISQAQAAAKEQESRLQEIEREMTRLADLKKKLGKYENILSQAQSAKEHLKVAEKEAAGLEERLKKSEFAAEAREALAAIESRLSALGYDGIAHQRCSERVRALLHFEEEKARLEEASSLARHCQEALEKTQADLAEAAGQEQAVGDELSALKAEVAALPAAREEHSRAAERTAKSEAQAREMESQAAVLKNDLERLAESRRALARRRKEREDALEETAVYGDLAASFGKNGVQALIIETAIPQLEQHANDLLARLSEGRMQVSFHTQKERGGEMAETLEIRIRDENGERRYEMYSGGEAFRLNFAIRLALSRLLTQRAGAKLSTLVIDEGFGSQDAEGRQRLVEAINAVAGDFERILVITHLDELKAEFPHRIEVTKDESGSHVRQTG